MGRGLDSLEGKRDLNTEKLNRVTRTCLKWEGVKKSNYRVDCAD